MGYKLQLMLHNKYNPEYELDLRNVIQLESHSTLDLICNKKFTIEVKKSSIKMKIQGNGETLLVKYRSKIPGYDKTTWFRNKVSMEIVSLNNPTKQYRVTYDSNDENFVMQRKE